MRNRLTSAFPNCISDDCISIHTMEAIIVYDDSIKSQSCVYNGDPIGLARPHFTIHNPNLKEIGLLAIDNCIIKGTTSEKCDFACFDDSIFCFVELKRSLGNSSNRRENRKKALSQLKTTLVYFLSKVNFEGYRIHACSCVGYSKVSPAAPASNLNARIEFLKNYKAELKAGDSMIFY